MAFSGDSLFAFFGFFSALGSAQALTVLELGGANLYGEPAGL